MNNNAKQKCVCEIYDKEGRRERGLRQNGKYDCVFSFLKSMNKKNMDETFWKEDAKGGK